MTVESLDEYLTNQYLADQQILGKLEQTIQKIQVTLSCAFNPKLAWPYSLKRGATAKSWSISDSTTAMVALSLFRLAGAWQCPRGFGPRPAFPPPRLHLDKKTDQERRKDTLKVAKDATQLLLGRMLSRRSVGTESTTFGKDDPLTLFFIANFFGISDRPGTANAWEKVRRYVKTQCVSHRDNAGAKLLEHKKFFLGNEASYVVSNALVPLRIVRAIRDFFDGQEQPLLEFRRYFETTLHNHLSFSSIPDSRFDPAELAFCLEGLLLAQKSAVDRSLFRRVLDVLASAQQENAFWRPTKPFIAESNGKSLFPVSVEVANSLVRSCEEFDGLDLHETFGSAAVPLFQRYWQWLSARIVTFPHHQSKVVGWHSEHVNEPDVIHIWESSQVLEFLVAFHRLLQAHIARTTLNLSRFIVKPYEGAPKPNWKDIKRRSEPVTSLGRSYKIYDRLESEVLRGWQTSSDSKSHSLLLYGPPGTGKTTVASKLAEALGFGLITITVSDFLAGGGAQIEARAKAIFDVLQAQSGCVVLFDEIDSFLLDRDTKRYADQDTVFQFMTPGMLTKLNDLRRAERIIFVVGTNYENRIDPAIKRTGRIDRRYLVLPPDAAARKRTIEAVIANAGRKPAPPTPTAAEWMSLIKGSVFLGFRDIEDLTREAVSSRIGYPALAKTLVSAPRATRLGLFTNRLRGTKNQTQIEEYGKWPFEEFICLLALAIEADEESHIDVEACRRARWELAAPSVEGIKRKILQWAPDISKVVAVRVARYLFEFGRKEADVG